MAIPASAIIDFATPNLKRNVPGTQHEVRARREWNWGLGHHRLHEHLQGFADPEGIFTDETLLVFPPNDTITLVWRDYGVAELGVRRPYIQELYKGCTSFQYIVVPINHVNSLPARFINSDVPPHVAMCTTSGKMMKAWGTLPAKSAKALQSSITERSKAAGGGGQTVPTTRQFDIMELTHRTWASADYVPARFRSASSDQTMGEWNSLSTQRCGYPESLEVTSAIQSCESAGGA
ncbi:hypothetical protein C8R47DRAFT_187392 [Mycena vitilis]|nr:hypothetical protein C8R47DRAFT_187392 [Mycena vitilis]